MVVVMTSEATAEEVEAVVRTVEAAGGSAFVSRGVHRTIVGLVGDVEQFETLNLDGAARRRRRRPDLRGLQAGQPGEPPGDLDRDGRRRADRTRHVHADRRPVCRRDAGADASPPPQMAKAAGAALLRGGAYKPRTSPYAFQGLGEAGLKILAEAREETGLPIVTEVVDAADVPLVSRVRRHAADRHPQHAELRAAAGGRAAPASRSCSSAA